jgi:6-pyruvoyl-tetrahydropterin synthase
MSCLFVQQLTVIDCAFLDAQRGLVGESWIVDVELEGDLDHQSMVLDFGEVKKRLKKSIDGTADHKLVVPLNAPQLKLHQGQGRAELFFSAKTGPIEHQSPIGALCLLQSAQVDVESVIAHLLPVLRKQVPENVERIGLTLRHESIDGAFYHYTHGLKKHAGHCQRIAHGHRSRLEIRVDGARQPKREAEWAKAWRDIYVGTSEDLISHRTGRFRFEYQASEGAFALEIPEERCDLYSSDSTVERIADLIADRIAGEWPGRLVEVRAFEGVMKGAISRRRVG